MTGRQTLLPAGGRASFDRRRSGVLRWIPAFIAAGAILVLTFGSATLVSAVDPSPLAVSFVAQDRGYNGETDAVVLSCAPDWGEAAADPNVACEVVTPVGEFADKSVGSQSVTAAISAFELTGSNATAYEITSVTPTTANISAIDLTVTATGINKVYNSSDAATVNLTTTAFDDDDVTAAYAVAKFSDKNVGSPKAVHVTGISISGDDAGNYNLTNATADTTANITVRDLTVDATGVNRGYDGTTTASVTVTDNRVGSDVFTISRTANFTNRNAGNNKPINVTDISISGTDAANYHLTSSIDSTSADVAKATLVVTAVANLKTADGSTSAANTPVVTGTIYANPADPGTTDDDVAAFIETYDTSAAGSGKTMTPSGIVNDGNGGANYSYAAGTFVTVATGQIRPGAVHHIAFTAQPIDTQVSTPILHTCTPGGAPCGSSSTPVQVTAYDIYNNLAGVGAPGADAFTSNVSITVADNRLPGTVLKTASTAAGVATFSGTSAPVIATLTVNPVTLVSTPTQLKAVATQALTAQVPAGSANVASNNIRIVDNIKACQGNSCFSSGNKANVHASYGRIDAKAGEVFFGTNRNVSLTTQFVAGSETKDRCVSLTKSSVKNSTPIGDATDLRVIGLGVTETGPTTRMLIVIPKSVMKASGVTARSASAFDVCLGAIWIGSGSPTAWTAKNPATSGTQPATISPIADPDGLVRYWGTPLDCSDARIKDSSGKNTAPCISLRTKQKSDIMNALGADAAALMNDADIGIIINKPANWDGKGGVW